MSRYLNFIKSLFIPKDEIDYYTITYNYLITLDAYKLDYYFKNNLYLRDYLPEYSHDDIEHNIILISNIAKSTRRLFTDFTETH